MRHCLPTGVEAKKTPGANSSPPGSGPPKSAVAGRLPKTSIRSSSRDFYVKIGSKKMRSDGLSKDGLSDFVAIKAISESGSDFGKK